MHEHNCDEVVDGWSDEKMIEYMKENGDLKDLPDENQLSLFDML